MAKENKKIAVALSGGVDSSVAAALLKRAGFDVTAIHLICYDEDAPYCTARKDREDAIRVASILNIPLKIFDFRKEYHDEVIGYFLREYEKGQTPNPDVMCNKKIKFGLLLNKVLKELNVTHLATGHYARISASYQLLTGVDPSKDQSYFLYILTQDQLRHILFPVGHLLKSEVRKLAKQFNLKTAEKKDSQGICFIGKVNVSMFLKSKIKSVPGIVINTKGERIGEHKGLPFYTIGQRHGFTINRYVGERLYVKSKDMQANVLIVGTKQALAVKEFNVLQTNWINKKRRGLCSSVRIRHLGEMLGCDVKCGKLEKGNEMCKVYLDKAAFGVAPGQSAVFYRGEEVLGGGIIR